MTAGSYPYSMSSPPTERPDLPEFMTWEELEQLPEEIAQYIELWDGRTRWVADEVLARTSSPEHQTASALLATELRRCARSFTSTSLDECWRATSETNLFFTRDRRSFLTPDFMAYRCPDEPYAPVFTDAAGLVGEVLSPSNTPREVDAKKRRYTDAGIPWYWEIDLHEKQPRVATVRAYALEVGHGRLPADVRPLRSTSYLLIKEWAPETNPEGIEINFPIPITIGWSELDLG